MNSTEAQKHRSTEAQKHRTIALAAIVAAGFLLGATGQAKASMILTSESQLSAGNQILSAPGNDFDSFINPLDISYTGGTASFNGPGGFVQRLTEGPSWGGNFTIGDPLFNTFSPGNLELLFSSDVTEVGTQFQSPFSNFTASISAFDASNNLIGVGTYTADGISTGSEDNSAVFLGFRNTTGDAAIRRVLFNTPDTDSNFVINQVSFGNNSTAAVPEPSTYAMFGLGVLALVALSRKRRADSLI